MSPDIPPAVESAAALYGVETSWVDADGGRRTASPEVVLDVLRRLGAPVDSEADLEGAALLRRRAIWERVCPPVRVVTAGEEVSLPLRLPAARARGRLAWRVSIGTRGPRLDRSPPGGRGSARGRAGEARVEELPLAGGSSVDGRRFEIRRLELPSDLPVGYHGLVVRHGLAELRLPLVVAPPRTYRGTRIEGGWGAFHPLSGLPSGRGAGVGDFRTLREAREWLGARGAVAFGTTPLVALFADPPVDPSPYAPASRLFWDDRYVDLEALPGYAEARSDGELEAPDRLARHRDEELVPWDVHTRVTGSALATLARRFFARRGDRSPEFQRFLAARPDVGDFARFMAARAAWGGDWRAWPEPARSGRPPAEALDRRLVERHLFGQWAASRQLAALAPAGEAPPGGAVLYLDIPLGTHPDGYDVWRRPELFAAGVGTGAPPDDFFRGGQDWGLPPLHPDRIREDGFRYVASVLRHVMGPAGLIRVDHVMQLHRLFWIPAGARPTDGVYVRYPADELAGVLALESHRARCEVAGEDLGTVPEAVRELMDRRGIRRTGVLTFDLEDLAAGRDPELPAGSVATIATHDMVPLAGLREAVDLDERERLGFLPEREAKELRARRRAVFDALDARLLDGPPGAEPEDAEPDDAESDAAESDAAAPSRRLRPDPLLAPLLSFLGQGRAGLVVAAVEDLVGARQPQNVPGTTTERPNWRRRLPVGLDEDLPPEGERALEALDAARRRPPRGDVSSPSA